MMPLQGSHHYALVPLLTWSPSNMTGTQVSETTAVQALQQQVLQMQHQVQLQSRLIQQQLQLQHPQQLQLQSQVIQQQVPLRQLSPPQDLQQNSKLQGLQVPMELQQHPQHQQQHQQQQQRPSMQQQSQHEQLRWHAQHPANDRDVQVHHQRHQSHQQPTPWLQLSQPPPFVGRCRSDDQEGDSDSEFQCLPRCGHSGGSFDGESPRYWQNNNNNVWQLPLQTTSKSGSMSSDSNCAWSEPSSQEQRQQRQSALANPYTDVVAPPSTSLRQQQQQEDYETMMIRNIPARFTKAQLLRDFGAHGSSGIDYLFLPVDLQSGKTKGMAFVNFRSKAQATEFQEVWHRSRLPNHGRGKVLDITAAQVHGVTANLAQFTDYTLESLRWHDALPVWIDEYGRASSDA
ncbi:unnamed protein product [Polarella glacialis]|uniref:RRM domain-containing protein n=2 Tax=Polarella glacialis TaxID=89957 RepID=A0A813K2G6_POLGL|nr:unnamed protein product [Polarella glacialis]